MSKKKDGRKSRRVFEVDSTQTLEYRRIKRKIDKTYSDYSMVRAAIFFLDIFLALMIITGSVLLIKTPFGNVCLMFGLVMLTITLVFWYKKKW